MSKRVGGCCHTGLGDTGGSDPSSAPSCCSHWKFRCKAVILKGEGQVKGTTALERRLAKPRHAEVPMPVIAFLGASLRSECARAQVVAAPKNRHLSIQQQLKG